MRTVTFAVRVLGLLGVKTLDADERGRRHQHGVRSGALMVIDDHINLTGMNPLVGANEDRFGPRFPDMTEVYSQRLREHRRRDRRRRSGCRCRTASTRRSRPELRDAGRDPLSADDRRGRRRHVHGARGDRRPAHGSRGARHLVHHQHGRGRAAAAARPRRGDGDDPAGARTGSWRCWRESLSDSERKRLSVSLVDVAEGHEGDFLALAGEFEALCPRKGYGRAEVVRDEARAAALLRRPPLGRRGGGREVPRGPRGPDADDASSPHRARDPRGERRGATR